MRRGISLLEVLVSMGVLIVGVLGALTMLPIAKYYSAEANKYDRASTLATQTRADSAVRYADDPARWIIATGSGPAWAAPGGLPDPALPDLSLVLVDPLGVAGNGTAAITAPPSAMSLAGAPVIPRFTLAMNADKNGPIIEMPPQPLLDLIFRSTDDQQFSRGDENHRPQALPGPQPDSAGLFSFAYLLRRRTRLDGGKVIFEPGEAVIESLTFGKRDLVITGPSVDDPPPERMVYADLNTTLPAGSLAVTLRGPASWLETKRLQPVLLSIAMSDPTAPTGTRTFAEWYIVDGGNGANVVLSGPDWPAMSAGWSDVDTSTPQPTVFATIFDGLVLVKDFAADHQ